MEFPSENFKLVETLKEEKHIKTKAVAKTMKDVDRADFTDFLPHSDW
jgi:hypothetical protein